MLSGLLPNRSGQRVYRSALIGTLGAFCMVALWGRSPTPAGSGAQLHPQSDGRLPRSEGSNGWDGVGASNDGASISRRAAWEESLWEGLEQIRSEPDLIGREELLDRLANRLSAEDFPQCADSLFAEEPSALGRNLAGRVLQRWASLDSPAAARWVAALPQECSWRKPALTAVLIAWANQDLASALVWARQWPEESERQEGLRSIAYEAARTNPVAALGLAIEQPAGLAQDALLVHCAARWGKLEPEQAALWARKISDPRLQQQVISIIATVWGHQDPRAAMNLALESLPPGRAQNQAVMGIVAQFAQQNPLQARTWVDTFPAGQLRQTAIEYLASLNSLLPSER